MRIRARGRLAGVRDEGETRTIGCERVLGNLVRSLAGGLVSSGEQRG